MLTNKESNKKMKTLILAGVISVMASASFAEANKPASTFTPYFGVERETKAKINNTFIGTTVNFGDLGVTGQINWNSATNDLNMIHEGADLDVSYGIADTVSLYLENDFNNDFEHTESTIGAKITF